MRKAARGCKHKMYAHVNFERELRFILDDKVEIWWDHIAGSMHAVLIVVVIIIIIVVDVVLHDVGDGGELRGHIITAL